MIRKALEADIPELLNMAQALVAESSYCFIKPSLPRIEVTIKTMIAAGFAMVAVIDDKPIGVMLGDVYMPWYSEDMLGIDYTIYVYPQHRNGLIAFKLIKAFEKWAFGMGAKQIRCGVGTDVVGVGRLYEKLAFKNVGAWYCKNKPHGI